MPGQFSKEARPVRPGAYFNWEAEIPSTIAPNIGSVVCVPIIHDWGPAKTIVPCLSFGDFQRKFGPSTTTPGYAAIKQCFKGEGVGGRGGAGEVLVYRMFGASGASGTVDLMNVNAATAITLTALYPGTYSDNLGVRIRVNSADPTRVEVILTLRGVVLETHTHDSADVAGHAAQINRDSKWVNATVVDDTDILDTSSPATITAFSSGDDGATLVAADWMDMLDEISNARFSIFAPYDMTDIAILTSIQEWCANLNKVSKRFMVVVGGPPADTADTAVDRSALMADMGNGGGGENIVNVGVGTLIDDELGTLSTSQLAPRIAGILAARGETMSFTFARMQGTQLGPGAPSDADVALCFDGGVVCFGQDSNALSPVRVEKALTTYTGGDDSKPYLIYRNPKFVRTMHGIELDISEWSTASAIGMLQVNDQTRALIVGYGHQVMAARASLGVIQDAYTVAVDPVPPPSDDDEFVAVIYSIGFGRSIEQIYNTVYLS